MNQERKQTLSLGFFNDAKPTLGLKVVAEPTTYLPDLERIDSPASKTKSLIEDIILEEEVPYPIQKDRSFSTDNPDHQAQQRAAKPFSIEEHKSTTSIQKPRTLSDTLNHSGWFTRPGLSRLDKLEILFQEETCTQETKAEICFKAVTYCAQLDDKSDAKKAQLNLALETWLDRLDAIWSARHPALTQDARHRILQQAQHYLNAINITDAETNHPIYFKIAKAKRQWEERQMNQTKNLGCYFCC